MILTQRRKLIIVGTLAATCLVGAFLLTSPPAPTLSFLSFDNEVEKEFIAHLARYGKTYASKSDLARRFKIFAENFKMVNEHNAKDTMYKMGFN